MKNSFELEILPDSMNRIKSQRLLTWVCLIGVLYWYPCFVFTGLDVVEEINPKLTSPWTRRFGRPRSHIRQCNI